MAELVDAPASGAGARKGVEVRVLFWAPVFGTKRMSGGHSPQKLPSASEGHAIGNPIPVPASAGSGGIFSKKHPSDSEGYALADY